MAEESLAFYVLVITVMIAAGYDSLVGRRDAAARLRHRRARLDDQPVRHGHRVRLRRAWASAPGSIGRIVILVVGTAIGIWWVMRYAATRQGGPGERRCSAPTARSNDRSTSRPTPATPPATADLTTSAASSSLASFFLAFVVMIIGVVPWADLGITSIPTKYWWFPEMTASFFAFSILIGFAGRMTEGRVHDAFVDGARDLLGVALIIGIARGVTVIMTNGQITDTVLNWRRAGAWPAWAASPSST